MTHILYIPKRISSVKLKHFFKIITSMPQATSHFFQNSSLGRFAVVVKWKHAWKKKPPKRIQKITRGVTFDAESHYGKVTTNLVRGREVCHHLPRARVRDNRRGYSDLVSLRRYPHFTVYTSPDILLYWLAILHWYL